MKFLPVTLWLLFFPIVFHITDLISSHVEKMRDQLSKRDSDSDFFVAISFFVIWFGIAALLLYCTIKYD